MSEEARLLARARSGDADAFATLAEAHADGLFRVALGLCGDVDAAEEVVQETFLRAWRGIARFEERAALFTWLYRIAVNEANRRLGRRARRRGDVPLDDPAAAALSDPSPGPHDRLVAGQHGRAVLSAIAALPPEQRAVLVLRDVRGLDTRQAAAVLGVGQAALKSRLHRARTGVRASVEGEARTGQAR